MSPIVLEDTVNGSLVSVPPTHELASLLQDELASATGLAARWAADRVQGNRHGLSLWSVPFVTEAGSKGFFTLCWSANLQTQLSAKLGAAAARPEFMGSLLRAVVGRWANQLALQGQSAVRLLPSPDSICAPEAEEKPSYRSHAALLIDGHVLELNFLLEQAQA